MPRTESDVQRQKLEDLENQLLSGSETSGYDEEEYGGEEGEGEEELAFEEGTVDGSSSNMQGTIVTDNVSQDVASESQA